MLFNKIQLLIRVTVLSHCDCMQAKLAATVEAATAAALAAQAKIDAGQQAKAALEAELQVNSTISLSNQHCVIRTSGGLCRTAIMMFTLAMMQRLTPLACL
jgi:hypothetical protein